MNLSISTWNYLCSYSDTADLTRAVDEIKADGFGLELWLRWEPDSQLFERERWGFLKELTRGISVISMHTSLFGDKEYDFDDLRKEIDLGGHLGARILVVHADTLNITDTQKNKVKDKQIRQAVKYAENRGVTLALENGITSILKQINVLRQIVDFCGIKVCLDVGHANCVFENSPMDFLDEFASEVVHFHFADNDGSSDQHLVPGAGNIAWGRILSRLKELNFSGQCVLELNTGNARRAAHQAREYLLEKYSALP